MYQRSRQLNYDRKPVAGAAIDTLDLRRLGDYFVRVLRGHAPEENEVEEWLLHLGLATTFPQWSATINGMLLFGKNPKRFLPQSGVRVMCYSGETHHHPVLAAENLKGPLVPLGDRDGLLLESGLVDQAWHFVRRNHGHQYPESVIREAVGNALVHRDYSIEAEEVVLAIFSNRLEIASPGDLSPRLTPAKAAAGVRYARNQTLVNVMRDYGYVDPCGMGVRRKLIPGMLAHNGTEPDLIEEEHRFTVRLWETPADTDPTVGFHPLRPPERVQQTTDSRTHNGPLGHALTDRRRRQCA